MSTSPLPVSSWFVVTPGPETEEHRRFLSENIWEIPSKTKVSPNELTQQVRSMKPGDRIALKAIRYCIDDAPFNSRGRWVITMDIYAVGTVQEASEDGRGIKVAWTPLEKPKPWYLYVGLYPIWKPPVKDWMAQALIDFAFHEVPQPIDRMRNHPYWAERFGDHYHWVPFYMEMATSLLKYRNDRQSLLNGIYEIAKTTDGFDYLRDKYSDGTQGPLKDISPFTVMGIFNRGPIMPDTKRHAIGTKIGRFLGCETEAPTTFEGIPLLDNRGSFFESFEKDRDRGDIECLWVLFEAAIRLADGEESDPGRLIKAFDNANMVRGLQWKHTIGLYWARPWFFPPLDIKARDYITKKLKINFPILKSAKGGELITGADYLTLRENLEANFTDEQYPVHSFPSLSDKAWYWKDGDSVIKNEKTLIDEEDEEPEDGSVESIDVRLQADLVSRNRYTVDDIVAEGSFLERNEIERILERLRKKKNVILQGPPGTGKTWLAKRIAYALMEEKDDSRLRAVQFHPNMSYEDFVRGWRPGGSDGVKLELIDGPFLEMIGTASNESGKDFVFVIEEINRGNPAQIFGEMLTLLEADKRHPDAALEITYRKPGEKSEGIFVPSNLYLIGTMNTADRSLAQVDFAFRRRFAFVDLEPRIGVKWKEHMQRFFQNDFLDTVAQRINKLNDGITAAPELGPQFRIGHSFFVPAKDHDVIADPVAWYRDIIETEIVPLLKEYWHDLPETVRKNKDELLKGF